MNRVEPGQRQSSSRRLSVQESDLLLQQVVGWSRSQWPLDEGLRAAARQVGNGRPASLLSAMASDVERGRDLRQVLFGIREHLAAPAARLVETLTASDDLLPALSQLLAQRREIAEDRRRLWAAMAYPLVTLLFALLVMLFMTALVYPQINDFVIGLGIEQGSSEYISAVAWTVQHGIFLLPLGLIILLLLLILTRWIVGRARWQMMWRALPLVGAGARWMPTIIWCRLVTTFLGRGVTLAEAVEQAGRIAGDAALELGSERASHGLREGRSVAAVMRANSAFPAMMVPLVAWGEQSGKLELSLDVAREVLERQVHNRSLLLRTVLPPLTLMVTAGIGLFVLASILNPLHTIVAFLSMGPTPRFNEASQPLANLCVLVAIGLAMLVAVRVAYGRRGRTGAMHRTLWIAACTFILLGLGGLAAALLGPLALILFVLAATILLMAVGQYRRASQHGLLTMLALAARYQVPLNIAAMAFGQEHSSETGLRASRLAQLLEQGAPLPVALGATRMAFGTDLVLAARIGDDTGDLATTFEQVLVRDDMFERTIRGVLEHLLYLGIVLLAIAALTTFLSERALPVLQLMMEEFFAETDSGFVEAADLPAGLQMALDASDWLTPLSLIIAFVTLAAIVIGALTYFKWWRWEPPLVRRLWRRSHSSLIMRALAVAVQQRRSMSDALTALSWQYPKAYIRRRLRKVAARVEHGADWRDSLLKSRLISAADAAVLHAAQRAGNLDWALQEMASSSLRRLAYRLRLFTQILFPAALLLMGLVVLALSLTMFQTLYELIMRQM